MRVGSSNNTLLTPNVLILIVCEYARLQGKVELKSEMEIRSLISLILNGIPWIIWVVPM